MQKQFKREQRYFVVKVKDAKEYLDARQLEKLAEIADTISEGREKDGIPAVDCVVVESDWPEYEPTWKAIEARVTEVQPAPSVPEGWKLVPIEVIDLYSFMCAAFVPMTPQQAQIAIQLDLAKRAMLAAPEAKP